MIEGVTLVYSIKELGSWSLWITRKLGPPPRMFSSKGTCPGGTKPALETRPGRDSESGLRTLAQSTGSIFRQP